MKKTVYVSLVLIGLIVSAILLYIPSYQWIFPWLHDQTLNTLAEPLLAIHLPEKTKKNETLIKVGHQIGNSNHCDYLAAIMLQTELPKEQLENYFKKNYFGESKVEFLWMNELGKYESGKFDPTTIHTLKDWVSSRTQSDPTNVVVYIFEVGMTSSFDYRCR